MIRRIQALNFRCLRYVDVPLGHFRVLVGPNGSGKSTLLDVVSFLSDLVRDGLDAAVEKRTHNFQDLVWRRPEKRPGFELAVEFDVPEHIKGKLPEDKQFEIFRYEIAVEESEQGVHIGYEKGILRPSQPPQQQTLFPEPLEPPGTILTDTQRPHGSRTILSKSREGRDNFSIEVPGKAGQGWATNIFLGPERSTLRNLPESPEKFPAATYVKQLLETGVQRLFLDSTRMRQSSPPERKRTPFASDGSNLPRVIRRLQEKKQEAFDGWLDHVRAALPEIEGVRVVDRDDDRHCYLMIRYKAGVEVPSWMVSDGTLRLLALTLPAFIPDQGRIYMLEEPENGLHPGVIQDVYDALASVYESQVLLATHSAVLLSHAELEHVLCFAKNDQGGTAVVPARNHPALIDWHGSPNISDFFAGGVLG